ncbi:MAG TPA: DUF1127 domain-containing protein [Pseudomonas sp.]|uniref:DUF1127 domain-containing protein n=1 Tax=Pseudomonas sp. TaxID=306 RepID=UPI002B45CEF2|nr:DUF1127 domain-containing protein [Pseudomonas sp.]HKS14996.1 DUF1127 domain-containing protein [Pseudomonas sp.]
MNSVTDLRLPLPADSLDTRPQPVSGRWAVMLRRWKTRRVLLTLDDAQLRDIGMTRLQARREGDKPFWRG